jgi:hypothetical protein
MIMNLLAKANPFNRKQEAAELQYNKVFLSYAFTYIAAMQKQGRVGAQFGLIVKEARPE